MKLLAESAFSSNGAGEDEQATCVLVEAMDDAHTRQRPLVQTVFNTGEVLGDKLFKRGRECLAFGVPGAFGGMANGIEAARLLDDDKVFVMVAYADVIIVTRCRQRF